MRSLFLSLFFMFISIFSNGQNPDKGIVFQDDIIPRIDILIANISLNYLLKPGNEWADGYHHADFVFSNNQLRDTILDIGFRLRGNTSRTSKKKSFKVSFNTFSKGRKYHGLEKLNLNGEHNDPTILRTKLCADLANTMGIIAPRVNHVELYINGDYYGLYVNVEHIDEQFVESRYGNKNGNLYKCLFPADLTYIAANPGAYKKEENGRRTYSLKINKEVDDYSDFAKFIKTLNKTSTKEFRCEFEKYFNVDSYIKNIVFDVLTANWDGYIFNNNNFYLYHNTETDKFEYILYDLDNTLGIDWFQIDWANRDIYYWHWSGAKRPLYRKVMNDPLYKSRFTDYMKTTLDSFFNQQIINQYLEDKRKLISEAVLKDDYRVLDYGFTFDDFNTSIDIAIDYNHTPIGIKEYIISRRLSAYSQLKTDKLLADVDVVIINYNDKRDSIQFLVKVAQSTKLESIDFSYLFDEESLDRSIELNDKGKRSDLIALDGVFSTDFIALLDYQWVHYALVYISNSKEYHFPACATITERLVNRNSTIVINEFMASNDNTISDEEGEYDDWIELYNNSSDSIYIGNMTLTDDNTKPAKWKLPDLWIGAKEYMIYWADKDEEQGKNHCNFKLSSSGEYIGLYLNDTDNETLIIDEVYFGEQRTDISEGRFPNGIGNYQKLDPSPASNNRLIDNTINITNQDVRISPNPTTGMLRITMDVSLDNAIIRILNARGQSIPFYKENTSGGIDLYMNNISEGLYFLQLNNNSRNVTSKFIVIN